MTEKLIFATHNAHKLEEVRQMLKGTLFQVVSADELNLPDVEETGETFEDNALIKAYAAYIHTGLPALADDSGLCIEALDNAPGVYSHRFAEQHGGFPAVFEEINRQLVGKERRAFFQCTMALVFDKKQMYTFDGQVNGVLLDKARGDNGFGYDPIFMPDGHDKTLAEMGAEAKNKISHRHLALEEVKYFLQNRCGPKV